MKRVLAVLLTGLTCLLGAGAARAQVSFSAGIEINSPGDFTGPLTPFGSWVSVSRYGRVWRPAQVVTGWRPYSYGRWEWTDLGWYWVSDEPWAWAVYHYGSWVYDPNFGWCWVPGTEWAPAWVSWRDSPDYIGWAPLGPNGVIFAPSQFVFVAIGGFNRPIRPNVVIVNNTTIINRTRVVNVNYRRETRDFNGRRERVVVNVGPQVNNIAKATGSRFTPRPVKELARETPVPKDVRRNGQIDRPALRAQNAQEWRQRRDKSEKQLQPTGPEQQGGTRQRPAPGSEQETPEKQKPEQQKPKPGQPDESKPTPSQPSPPTGRDRPRPPQGQQTNAPAVSTPDRKRPEQRPVPVPQNPDQAQPNRSRPTSSQPPPPTGRDQSRPSQREQTNAPAASTPDRVRPEQRTAPAQNSGQGRSDQSAPSQSQPPSPTSREQSRPPQHQQTRPPSAPTPDQAPQQHQRPNKDKDNPQ